MINLLLAAWTSSPASWTRESHTLIIDTKRNNCGKTLNFEPISQPTWHHPVLKRPAPPPFCKASSPTPAVRWLSSCCCWLSCARSLEAFATWPRVLAGRMIWWERWKEVSRWKQWGGQTYWSDYMVQALQVFMKHKLLGGLSALIGCDCSEIGARWIWLCCTAEKGKIKEMFFLLAHWPIKPPQLSVIPVRNTRNQFWLISFSSSDWRIWSPEWIWYPI